MMNITVLCVGKNKESFYREALAEYVKRLSKYCKTKIIEVKDEPTPDGASASVCEDILRTEGERLLGKMPSGAYIIATAVEGKSYTSEEMADMINALSIKGVSHICFVIGGSLGLSDEIKKRADLLLSFSKMTFPHGLMRVILAEQIYRSFRIIKNEPYHK